MAKPTVVNYLTQLKTKQYPFRNKHLFTTQKQFQKYLPKATPQLQTAPDNDAEKVHKAEVNTVYLSVCAATFLAAVHRQNFSVMAVTIQQAFNFTMPEMGLLQASMLFGYVFGQFPSGILADKIGGAHLLMVGLFLWSACNAGFAITALAASPLVAMMLVRASLGLSQSVLMPSVAAASATWFDDVDRSTKTSNAWAIHSLGAVLSLCITPAIANVLGWQALFAAYGALGMVVAAIAYTKLPVESKSDDSSIKPKNKTILRINNDLIGQLLLLCWTHSVIGFEFFVYQAWVPTFIYSLGLENMVLVGALSALPWVAVALLSIFGGRLADHLRANKGWSTVSVRKLMQAAAFLGSLVLLPLVVAPDSLSPMASVACLTIALAAQGLNYSGFHSYAQEVALQNSGAVVGLTNSCGVIVGLAGNVLTGQLADSAFGFRGVFGLTILLSVVGALSFVTFADGKPLKFSTVVQ